MRVALFVTCLNDTLFPEVGRATVAILERLGIDVDFPEAQTCCGQMHFNSGYVRGCAPMVRRFVDVFSAYDTVVTPSGSCCSMVREQYPRVARAAGDPDLAAAAGRVAPKVYDLSEFLCDLVGVERVAAELAPYFPHRVTYHPTCHSLRLLRVGDRPYRLLRAVRGLELLELPDADQCCGFGGTFALKNAATSTAMCTDKARHVVQTGAEVVVSGDSSCLMNIGGALSRWRSGVATAHLAEVLAATEHAPAGTSAPGAESRR